MKVAVVGAGYAGLAVAWHLLQKNIEVTVFDGGEGASHASTGLLHPCPGKRAVPTWRAEEGMQAAIELLEAASRERTVFVRNGIFRITSTGERLWIPDGITVYSKLYLEGLKKACAKAKFERQWIQNLQELDPFDAIVLSAGAETLQLVDLPLKKTIGQCLVCRWEKPLKESLLAYGHITPTEDPELCLVGSTYEHTDKPDPKKALALLNQAAVFYPPAKDFKIVEILSGVRIAPKAGYRPIVAKVNPKTWVFTGLGSRGLIYHSLLAKEIAISL